MFNDFEAVVSKQFDKMKGYELFKMDVEKDTIWETYINNFPEGTNPIFLERTQHDCQCCRNYVRSVGNVVAIIDGKLESIWDVQVDSFYQGIADKLSALVKSKPIKDIFLHIEKTVGSKPNFRDLDGNVLKFEHFFMQVPPNRVVKGADKATKLAGVRTTKEVFQRSLNELTDDSINTVLELISQNSLYRGDEHKFVLTSFSTLKKEYAKLKTDTERDIYCWSKSKGIPESISRIRGTVIGSLLIDLSEGKELEHSVKSFETKVAPTNYKRPTALVTKAMIESAKEQINLLGLSSALERRYATLQDITVNNILFADRQIKKNISGNVFDELSASVPEKSQKFDKVEEVNIETFIKNILPTAESVEVMFENRHSSNLVSLIAPVDTTANNLFKWDNKFSWSYTGDLTDSIKERVKTAGGKIDGDLRCSLSWFNYDDLDLSMLEPGGHKIFFGNRGNLSTSNGTLDVDMNAGSGKSRNAVENICYANRAKMQDGIYTLIVHNYSQRETKDVGFEIEIEFDGNINTISYPKIVKKGEYIEVAQIQFSKKEGFKIIKSLPSSLSVKEVWSIPTQSFHKVNVMLLSPNHWDERAIGNKHYFFMLDKCMNEGNARGFFNEFLTPELDVHRKVFEIVGSKMKTESSEDQLSGLGFSSTNRNSILCRVKGNFTRVIKLTF